MNALRGLLFVSLISFNAAAYTHIKKFECADEVKIQVRSALAPNGQRFFSARSEKLGGLERVQCEELHDQWQNYGSKNCYVNDDYLFSYIGEMEVLNFHIDGMRYFSLCILVEEIM